MSLLHPLPQPVLLAATSHIACYKVVAEDLLSLSELVEPFCSAIFSNWVRWSIHLVFSLFLVWFLGHPGVARVNPWQCSRELLLIVLGTLRVNPNRNPHLTGSNRGQQWAPYLLYCSGPVSSNSLFLLGCQAELGDVELQCHLLQLCVPGMIQQFDSWLGAGVGGRRPGPSWRQGLRLPHPDGSSNQGWETGLAGLVQWRLLSAAIYTTKWVCQLLSLQTFVCLFWNWQHSDHFWWWWGGGTQPGLAACKASS